MSKNQTGSKKRWAKFLIICVFAVMSCVVLVYSIPYVGTFLFEISRTIHDYEFDNGMREFVALDGGYKYKITIKKPALYAKPVEGAVYRIEGVNDKEWKCLTIPGLWGIEEYKLYRHNDINEEPILDWEISEIKLYGYSLYGGRLYEDSYNENLDITYEQTREIQEILRGEPLAEEPAIDSKEKFFSRLVFSFKDKKGVKLECNIITVDKRKNPESPDKGVYLEIHINNLSNYYDVTSQLRGAMDKYFKDVSEEPIRDWEISEIELNGYNSPENSYNERLNVTYEQIREIQEILSEEPLAKNPRIDSQEEFCSSLIFSFKDKKDVTFKCNIITVDKRKNPESHDKGVYLEIHVKNLTNYYDVTSQLRDAMDKYFDEHQG